MSFLDTAEDEMAKPLQQVSLSRLQTLLDLGAELGHDACCYSRARIPSAYIKV